MSTTVEEVNFAAQNESILRRRQLKYVLPLAEVIEFASLNGAEIFPANDSLRSIAKIADGGIVFNKKLYMLPHTAAIACQAIYAERWKPVDGWKFWNVVRNGSVVSLESIREELLDAKMLRGDVISD